MHVSVQLSQNNLENKKNGVPRRILRWSEWRDSNSRPHGPEPCALPTALHPDMKFYGFAPQNSSIIRASFRSVKGRIHFFQKGKSQALNAHNFSLLVLSNFDKPTWPPSCPMVGSLRVFLFCSPCSAPLTSSPFDCPLCWFLPVTRSARSPAGTPGT